MQPAVRISSSIVNGWPSPIQETPSQGTSGRATHTAVKPASSQGRMKSRGAAASRRGGFGSRLFLVCDFINSVLLLRRRDADVRQPRDLRPAVVSRIAITHSKQAMDNAMVTAPATFTCGKTSAARPQAAVVR